MKEHAPRGCAEWIEKVRPRTDYALIRRKRRNFGPSPLTPNFQIPIDAQISKLSNDMSM